MIRNRIRWPIVFIMPFVALGQISQECLLAAKASSQITDPVPPAVSRLSGAPSGMLTNVADKFREIGTGEAKPSLLKGSGISACVNPASPWSIFKEPPPSCPFYAGNPLSVSPWPLPVDIATTSSEHAINGNTLARNAWLGANTLTEAQAENVTFTTFGTPGSDDDNAPLYIAAPIDPFYNMRRLSQGAPPFRSPKNVPYISIGNSAGNGDSKYRILDPVSKVLAGDYKNAGCCPPPTIGTSTSISPPGVTVNPNGNSSGLAWNAWTDQDWGKPHGYSNNQGDEGSGQFAPFATLTRNTELENTLIPHAVNLMIECNGDYTGGPYSGPVVFPALWYTVRCSEDQGVTSPMPPAGSLLYLDYTPAQIDTQMPGLTRIQRTILTALSTYGGYFNISRIDFCRPLGSCPPHTPPPGSGQPIEMFQSFEDGTPYQLATGGKLTTKNDGRGNTAWYVSGGTRDPIFAYLDGQGVPCNKGSGTSDCKYPLFMWSKNLASVGTGVVPNVVGPNCPSTPCDISGHWHMADPCVAVGLAGGAAGFPLAMPTPCVGAAYINILGPGTITERSGKMVTTVGGIARISAANSTTITLVATARSGHTFTGWTGACTGKSTCVLTLDGRAGTRIMTATFSPQTE